MDNQHIFDDGAVQRDGCYQAMVSLRRYFVLDINLQCKDYSMMAFTTHRQLLPIIFCFLMTACAHDGGMRSGQRWSSEAASGGLNERVVIGGMDKVAAGQVITHYMDDQAKELKPLADTLRVGDGIIVTLPQKLLFKTDNAVLIPQSHTPLRKLAAILKKYPKTTLTIVGHTDNRGFADFDIHLSEGRARSVAEYLIKLGIATQRVRIMGMGFARPVADNNTVEGRLRNQRVEIHIAPDENLREEDQSQPS